VHKGYLDAKPKQEALLLQRDRAVDQLFDSFSKSRIVHEKCHSEPYSTPFGVVIRTLGVITINVCAKFEVYLK